MRITRNQLRQIIQEETRVLNEGTFEDAKVNTSQALESLLSEFILKQSDSTQSMNDKERRAKWEFHKHMKNLLAEPDASWYFAELLE
jgi:hypothetical protein